MIEVRNYSRENLEKTYGWITDPDLRKPFLFSRNVTKESHLQWFDSISKSATEQIFSVYADGVHVGNLGLKNIDNNRQEAETWIYIGDSSFKGRGVAYEAYLKFFEQLHSERKINSLYCHIASFNTASQKLFLKLGFIRDHTFSEPKVWEGQPYELYRFTKKLQ